MNFWVYESHTTNHATVHAAWCGYCNDGRGRRLAGKGTTSGRWIGPYAALVAATEAGEALGRPLGVHSCCGHGASRPNPAPDRFQLPVVDEASLSLADLFHHRMLQIYVDLRDEIGYSATRFLRSVRAHGGVEHAKRSLRRPLESQTGFERLKQEGRLHQSMEAFVCLPEFSPLFTPGEISEAQRRLAPFV